MYFATDMTVYSVAVPIIPLYIRDTLHMSDYASGYMFAIYSVSLLIFTPIFGILTDNYGRRLPMLVFEIIGIYVTRMSMKGHAFTMSFFCSAWSGWTHCVDILVCNVFLISRFVGGTRYSGNFRISDLGSGVCMVSFTR